MKGLFYKRLLSFGYLVVFIYRRFGLEHKIEVGF